MTVNITINITMKSFNVILEDYNHRTFIPYDVMPYLVDKYKESREKPKTFEEFKKFVKDQSMYQWWARCEYEIVLQSWPTGKNEEKIDVYWQILLNIDLVTEILIENVKE